MAFSLDEVATIAREVGGTQQPALDVIAVTGGEGGGESAEVILTVRGCRHEPCTVVVGVDRTGSPDALRSGLASQLRRHLEEHRR